jgi:hypothetical protein
LYAFEKDYFDEIVGRNKISFSKMGKTKGVNFKDFYWQNGYGAFSVKPSEVDVVFVT